MVTVPDPSELQSYAEIAITLAGLTGIIGVIQKRSEAGITRRERVHLVTLLVSAVLVVFYSFLPHWISQYPGAAEHIWVWSVRALFVGHVVSFSIFMWISQGMKVVYRDLPKMEFVVGMMLFPWSGITAVVLEGAISFGYLTEYAAFVYEGVLVLHITLGLYNFVSLLLGAEYKSAA
jgi:hypothetical protein